MKTHVLFGIVAFLVRPIWVLLAKAGCILRLHVRVEAHPRTTLQAALQVHSAATPFLRSGGKDQAGRGIRSSYPGLLPEASQPGLDAGTSLCEGFSHPANITTRSWKKMEDPSAMIQVVFHLHQAVPEEPQEPDHVLMPHEHRNAA
jgi:hypothetical protein